MYAKIFNKKLINDKKNHFFTKNRKKKCYKFMKILVLNTIYLVYTKQI